MLLELLALLNRDVVSNCTCYCDVKIGIFRLGFGGSGLESSAAARRPSYLKATSNLACLKATISRWIPGHSRRDYKARVSGPISAR